jgi:lipopolysaccharide biosynthesis regulator YciM
MFIRISFLSIIIFGAIFIYLSALNPFGVTFQYLKGNYIETSLSVLLVVSFFIGALLLFLMYSIRDIRRSLRERKQKREREQLWDLFYSATDALFKNDLPKAEKQILSYLKKKPDDPHAYLKLAEVYQKGGKVKKAIETLERASDLKKDKLEILFMEAQIYKTVKDYDGAARTFKEIVALNPNNREAMKELRDIYIEEKEWEEALKLQRKILKVSAKGEIDQEKTLQQGLHYERARLMAEKGKEERGIKDVREILKENSSFVPAQVLLGELLRQAGKTKDAIRIWRRGFEKSGEIIFLNKLEDLYLSQEHPRGIINLYLEAMDKNPDNIIIPFFYARLCLRLEMIDEALDKLEEMDINLSNHPSYHYLLAEVYAHHGDYEKAMGEYRKGLKLEGGAYYVPYLCTNCQKEIKNWLPRCPECGQWGTFIPRTTGEVKVPFSPLPSRLMAWDF